MHLVRIFAEKHSPRLNYICDVLFRIILGGGFKWTDAENADLIYGSQALPGKLRIPSSGLLQAPDIDPHCWMESVSLPFPALDTRDFFAWAFFMLVEYPLYTSGESIPPTPREAQLEDLAAALASQLGLSFPESEFSYEVTIDVDHPWKHRFKPLHVRWGGFLRSLLRRDWESVQERWCALFKRKDPFDIDEEIQAGCPPDKTTLFFLVGGNHPRDSRFSLRLPAYSNKVRAYQQAGFHIGLHPSYLSSEREGILHQELKMLEQVTGKVTRSRQHYLRYRLPDTFQKLEAAGIEREYSTCFNAHLGPKTRISRPYPWFDLAANRVTDLEIVPAMVMDRTLLSYLKLGPAAALKQIFSQIDAVKNRGGHFVIILHNETFSDSGEWKGWSKILKQLMEHLRHDGSPT